MQIHLVLPPRRRATQAGSFRRWAGQPPGPGREAVGGAGSRGRRCARRGASRGGRGRPGSRRGQLAVGGLTAGGPRLSPALSWDPTGGCSRPGRELPIRAWLGRPHAGSRARPGCSEKTRWALQGGSLARGQCPLARPPECTLPDSFSYILCTRLVPSSCRGYAEARGRQAATEYLLSS